MRESALFDLAPVIRSTDHTLEADVPQTAIRRSAEPGGWRVAVRRTSNTRSATRRVFDHAMFAGGTACCRRRLASVCAPISTSMVRRC